MYINPFSAIECKKYTFTVNIFFMIFFKSKLYVYVIN